MLRLISIEGPVELVDGTLVLLIPLEAGGSELVECTTKIAEVVGEHLKISIPDWLAAKLGICEGSMVRVHNQDGKFNIHLCLPN